jgi:hypothetical protein
MNLGIAALVVVLALLVIVGFPTRKRMERAFKPSEKPPPHARIASAYRSWRKARAQRRRRRHLRKL